jgi:hypothetical protein
MVGPAACHVTAGAQTALAARRFAVLLGHGQNFSTLYGRLRGSKMALAPL